MVYSNKGHLVFLFYPTQNTKGITDTCYYTSEMSFNSRILNSIVDNLIADEQSTREWLKQNPLTLKFTSADGGSIYLMVNNENFFVRAIDSNGQEKYTFVHILDVPTICSIADYLSQWSLASVMCDILGSSRRRSQPQQIPQQMSQYQQPIQQYQGIPQQSMSNQPQQSVPYVNNQPQQNYQQPQTNQPQQLNGFPSPDEIG
jgi:hypothetical protein